MIVTKEKQGRKRKSEGKERRRREKSNGCTLSFYNSYFGKKKLFDAKGPLGDNVIKDLARYNSIRNLLIKNLLTTIHK